MEEKHIRKYVPVVLRVDENGKIRPLVVEFDEQHKYLVDQVTDVRRAACQSAGGVGDRYSCLTCTPCCSDENVVCVVTRYFGGVLLGAGGLSRAYGKAAKDALDAAGKARMTRWTRLLVRVPYPILERLERLTASLGGVTESSDYGADVAVTLRLPGERAEAFEAARRSGATAFFSCIHPFVLL